MNRPRTLARNSLRQIARIKVRTRGKDVGTRQEVRTMARDQAYALAGGMVIDRGTVMHAPVARAFTDARKAYAKRIQDAREQHPISLADARVTVATARKFVGKSSAIYETAVDHATRKDARAMYRHDMRKLIQAEHAVTRLEAVGENLPSISTPRPAPVAYEIAYVQAPANVAYPVRSSTQRTAAVLNMRTLTTAAENRRGMITRHGDNQRSPDIAARGVRAAEARSAARRAKMDEAATAA